jgi:1-deoxy-D-xylulose-5-phosphate reductoisomerase
MMNKGFEVIEARWLFDVSPSKINVVIHPESVIHSMIEFEDGAVIAQMGMPDMREPIQFALSYPERLSLDNRKIDFPFLGKLTFFEPSKENFPCLGLAFKALERGGNIPCAMNAANEVAVQQFIEGRIGFLDIADRVEAAMQQAHFIAQPTLDDLFETDNEIRKN